MQSLFRLTPAILAIALVPHIAAQAIVPPASAKPPAPVGVSATVVSTGIQISWNPATGTPAGTTYNIYRGDGSTKPDITSTGPPGRVRVGLNSTDSPYVDTGVASGGEYNYVVVAVSGAASSEASASSGKEAFQASQSDSDSQQGTPASTSLPVSCPANSATVINNCVTIGNYKSFLKSENGPIDVGTGTINYSQLASLPKPAPPPAPTCDASPDAILYNVIKLSSDQSAATPQWYLYERKPGYKKGVPSAWSVTDFDNPTRLYGIKKLEVVSIVLNAATDSPTVTYVIQSTKAQPTNVSDFLALLSVVGASGTKASPLSSPKPANFIGCATVDTGFSTSSIQVTANIQVMTSGPNGQNAKLLTASQTITNEAKAWWDVSFALPIKKASALQYNSTSNTVTATQVNKENLFATFDFYPFRSDLRASYSWSPAFFGGVSLASQPLHSILTGVSMHFNMVSVYAGALFIKQQQLNGLATGASGTPAQVSAATSYSYQPSFSVGIKLSIKAGAAQLTSSK